MPTGDEEQSQFKPKAAIVGACAFSVYFGYIAGGQVLRAKLPIAGWLAPAFPLVCLLLPEGPRTKPEWPADLCDKLRRYYTILLVSFAWTMALGCSALAATNETAKSCLALADFACLSAILWAGHNFSETKKALRPLKPEPAEAKRAGVDFFEDSCPHCNAQLAIFPEDRETMRCACGAVLKIERTGSGGSLSVAELP